MQFGVSTFLWVSPFSTQSFDLLYKIRDMGFDIIEIAVEKKELIDWKRLKEMIKETGLKVTISGAFGPERDISSEDARIREQGKNYIIDCIRIAQDMGSPVFGARSIRPLVRQGLSPQSRKKGKEPGVWRTFMK